MNIPLECGHLPIYRAAHLYSEELVRILLERGALVNLDFKDSLVCVPLRNPSYYVKCSKGIVKLLLEAGADPLGKDFENKIPIMLAVRHVSSNVVRLLRRYGASTDTPREELQPYLQRAFFGRNVDVTQMLLEEGCSPNGADENGQIMLHYAAWNGWVEMAKALILHGADLNVHAALNDQTPLMHAIARNEPLLVNLLLEHGVDPNATDIMGDIAFFYASGPYYLKVLYP